MIHYPHIRKWVTYGVVLLLGGLSLVPSISYGLVKASDDVDRVTLTCGVSGVNGCGDTSVQLTRQQFQDLQRYIVDFRARVNQTKTREEAVPLFKEAIVELNKYGLLPKGMSVREAQWLATGSYQNYLLKTCAHQLISRHLLAADNGSNYLCLIAGEHWGAFLMHVGVNAVLMPLYMLCYPLRSNPFFEKICEVIEAVYMGRFFYTAFIPIIPLPSLGTGIFFTYEAGAIKTIGLLGEKTWEGCLIGGYRQTLEDYYGLGVQGFTGFHITLQAPPALVYDMIFFGTALAVNIVVVY